jgi:AraC-like DNA-binding protein
MTTGTISSSQGHQAAWQVDRLFDSAESIAPILDGTQARWFAFRDAERPYVRVRENLFENERFSLGVIHSSGYQTATDYEGYCGVLLPLSGSAEMAKPRGNYQAGADAFLIHAFGPTRLNMTPAGNGDFRALSFAFSQDLLKAWADVLDGEARAVQPTMSGRLDAGLAMGHRLREGLHAIAAMTEAGRAPRPDSVTAWMTERVAAMQILLAMGRGLRPAATAGLAQVRAAEDFILAHCRTAISIPDVARHLGVSLRALQAAFQKHRGYSPKWALTSARLEAAHADIMAAETGRSVTEIAMGCGFWHLSRFAGAYRDRFGALPSAHLARGFKIGRGAAM